MTKRNLCFLAKYRSWNPFVEPCRQRGWEGRS